MQRIRLPNGLSVYHLNRTNTEIVYREIFVEQQYRRHGISFQPGACIIDVGANIGLFALFINTICPKARVLSVEPIPEIFEVLRANIELCEDLEGTAVNVGLGAQSGWASFSYYPRLACASTMHPDESAEEAERGRGYVLERFGDHPNRLLAAALAMLPPHLRRALAERVRRFYRRESRVTCELRTLSQLIAEYGVERIDLLKIDAERSEVEILQGIGEKDWPKIGQAVVETHRGEGEMNEVRDTLRGHGFLVETEQSRELPNIHMLYALR